MAWRQGVECKLYYKVGGVEGAGNWIELKKVRDLTTTWEKDEVDLSCRGSRWKMVGGRMKSVALEFDLLYDDTDTGFIALRTAWWNDQLIGLRALASTGGKGYQGDFEVMSWNRGEPLGDKLTVSITAKGGFSETEPSVVGE